MNQIQTLLRIARRRLEMTAFFNRAHQAAIVAAGLILALIIADKVPAEEFLGWNWLLPSILGVALLVAFGLWMKGRRSDFQVAMAVDERLGLREKLSTALHCRGRDDVFAQAAIEDAVKTAGDARNRERVSRQFQVEPPRGWWISPMVLVLALMVSFLSPLDLFADDEPVVVSNIQSVKAEVDTSMDELVKEIKEKPELSKELADLLGDLTDDGLDPDAMKSPNDIKRNAIKKVTDLSKKLEDLLNSEKSMTLSTLENALKQLETPEDGPANDLADALSAGNFDAALKALDKLKAQMENGELTEEQKKQLEKQLKDMADQLKKLSEQKEELEAALKKAGLDPQLANNPQALQQAIENNKTLNEQQKQQLQQMAQAQQAANKMCQGLGQACQKMGQGMQNGKFGEGTGKMGQQLSQMEAMSQLMREAQAMASMCQGQCNKMGQGLAMKQGNGAFGGPGRGRGGKAPLAPTPTGNKEIKAPVKTQEGDIIAKMLIDGQQIVGESKAKLKQVAANAAERTDEALTEDQLPRRYHETQKHYFGELKKLTEATISKDDEETETETKTESEASPPAENEKTTTPSTD